MIIVEDVHKRYRTEHGPGKWVLQGASFSIPSNINVGLIGGNGAGKSTLLRLIGGVDQPTRGRIERRCRVSWPMGLSSGLQPSLTGRQNVRFVCRIHGDEAYIPDRIAFIQDFAEIGSAFDEPIKTYSSGMRSRLQFALSLAIDFDVYISDEITGAGDTIFRKKAASAFKNLADRASLVMVSHDEGTLRQFCTAGVWLNDGRAYWFDDIKDALTEYKKCQLSAQISHLISQRNSENQAYLASELEKAKETHRALAVLEKGENGFPDMVGHEEGLRIMQLAKQFGMPLVGEGQLSKLGYKLKPNAKPVLIKLHPAPYDQSHVNIYKLDQQCIKMVSVT